MTTKHDYLPCSSKIVNFELYMSKNMERSLYFEVVKESIPQQEPNEKKNVHHINPKDILVYLYSSNYFFIVARIFVYIMQY